MPERGGFFYFIKSVIENRRKKEEIAPREGVKLTRRVIELPDEKASERQSFLVQWTVENPTVG